MVLQKNCRVAVFHEGQLAPQFVLDTVEAVGQRGVVALCGIHGIVGIVGGLLCHVAFGLGVIAFFEGVRSFLGSVSTFLLGVIGSVGSVGSSFGGIGCGLPKKLMAAAKEK